MGVLRVEPTSVCAPLISMPDKLVLLSQPDTLGWSVLVSTANTNPFTKPICRTLTQKKSSRAGRNVALGESPRAKPLGLM